MVVLVSKYNYFLERIKFNFIKSLDFCPKPQTETTTTGIFTFPSKTKSRYKITN
jgi:hypothetical protein